MLDFNRIKEIKLTDVLARYKSALRFKTDYAVCACPLPIHKKGDTSKSFSINLGANYWICFSDSCNANNGGKRGGDVINFVALMEGCREKDAAQKLSDWFKVAETKTPTRIEQGRKPTEHQQNAIEKPSTSSDSVKYMALIDVWYDEVSVRVTGESDEDYRKRFLKGLKAKLIESYKAGQKAR
jgi:hypothetical protein